MSYMNQVILLGTLSNDPKILKETDSGCFVKFSVVTHKFTANANGEKKQESQWHTVSVNDNAEKEMTGTLKKGQLVMIYGELRNSKWKDRKTEEERSETGICAKTVLKIASKIAHNNEQIAQNDEQMDKKANVSKTVK